MYTKILLLIDINMYKHYYYVDFTFNCKELTHIITRNENIFFQKKKQTGIYFSFHQKHIYFVL